MPETALLEVKDLGKVFQQHRGWLSRRDAESFEAVSGVSFELSANPQN